MDPKIQGGEYGYYDIRSPVSRTRMCLSCHVGNVREGRVVTHEMFAAGHPPLPGFDVETFSQPGTATLAKLPRKIGRHARRVFGKNQKTRGQKPRKRGWRTENGANDLHNTRDLLIGSLVNLSEMLRLTLDLADPDVTVPNRRQRIGQAGPNEQWPEFALFRLLFLPHDLQDQGWRFQTQTHRDSGSASAARMAFCVGQILP